MLIESYQESIGHFEFIVHIATEVSTYLMNIGAARLTQINEDTDTARLISQFTDFAQTLNTFSKRLDEVSRALRELPQ
jgi:hypothetical protein